MKTTSSPYCACAAILVTLFALVFNARAQTVITSIPHTITLPGNYVLNSNFSYAGTTNTAITIAASNVTIDFQGHFIQATDPSAGANGIHATNRGNITIKNGTVAGFSTGIVFEGTTNNQNNVIENMRSISDINAGIRITDGKACRIEGCQVRGIGGIGGPPRTGVGIGATGSVVVRNNQVSQVGGGLPSFGISGTDSVFIIGNQVDNCDFGIVGGKYQNNLTFNCATPFSGGIDAEHNN